MKFVRILRVAPIAAMLAAASLAAGAEWTAPVVSGLVEQVFDWERDSCARWDIPDTPARAWRDGAGRVGLVAGSEESRASRGPDLDTVRRDCAVLHRGAGADDPAVHDDRSWIASIMPRADGVIEALGHVEYHGHRRPERCGAADYLRCWRNAIVELRSDDGGQSFVRRGTGDLVAVLPYRYDGAAGRRTGYFSPSNIVQRGAYLHVFVFAERYRAQRRGVCLLRRPIAGGAGDWRAWDGRDFTVRFVDPYREEVANPAAHVCAPVPELRSTLTSVVWHAASARWLAVTPGTRNDAGGRPRTGIYALVSDDLVNWSSPALIHEVPLLWRRDCAAPVAYAYPALLDGDGTTANFQTIDDEFWLYLVEMTLGAGCRISYRRDLIRLTVNWPWRAARP